MFHSYLLDFKNSINVLERRLLFISIEFYMFIKLNVDNFFGVSFFRIQEEITYSLGHNFFITGNIG